MPRRSSEESACTRPDTWSRCAVTAACSSSIGWRARRSSESDWPVFFGKERGKEQSYLRE
jgi:hypothetical protein